MRTPYTEILREHLRRYPQMQPQDFAKLLYQAEFGPRHMQQNTDDYLLTEWQGQTQRPPQPPERISAELYRFHLGGGYQPEATAPLLNKLFQLTQRRHSGTLNGLRQRVAQLQPLLSAPQAAEVLPWLQNWLAQGAPPAHHSAEFRRAYQPHYRLLCSDLAGFFPALLACQKLATEAGAGSRLIAVDGRCGSGKTTLAALIHQLMPPPACRIIHMDDFYLPIQQRPANWQEIPAGHMDLARLQTETLQPALNGAAIIYRPYDCQRAVLGEPRELPPARLTVIEGSYALHPALAGHYALKIFLDVSPAIQAERLQEREGAYYPQFVEKWIPQEERYLRQCGVEQTENLLKINTDQLF